MATLSHITPRRLSADNGTSRPKKLVFVFSGYGSHWLGMGRQLLGQEEAFRSALEQCEREMSRFVDWSLLEEINADRGRLQAGQIDVVQPALFAIQVSLAALWDSWSVKPDVVVGHSMGEIAAAYVAGALDLKDAVRVICRRSQLLKQTSGKGAMAAVGLSCEEAEQVLAGLEDCLSVAASNSPFLTILSGDPAVLKGLINTLKHQHIFCRWINVDVASHSPQVVPLLEALFEALKEVRPRLASVPFYSTVTSEVSSGRELDAGYWVRNLREQVRFSNVVQHLVEDGCDIFLEISPHPVLLPAIHEGLLHHRKDGTLLPSLRRYKEERAEIRSSLNALHALRRLYDDAPVSAAVYQ